MNCLKAEITSHPSRIKQALRIIGKHAAIWPICNAIHGTMNLSTQVKYKLVN